MKKIIVLLMFAIGINAIAQQQDVKTLQETARTFSKQGDYNNAILVLSKALEQEPNNLSVTKDLSLAYYQKADYGQAKSVITGVIDRPDADAAVFQIAGMLYKTTGEVKECDKIYKKALKQFPRSGALYNDYGELLWGQRDFSAIRQWEKGIEVDPNFSTNYFNAARYYYLTVDKVWSILYAEMFINLESYTQRTAEAKNLLLESYKKLFTESELQKKQDTRNPFVAAYLNSIGKQSYLVMNGITPESLTMIRTRFILDWIEQKLTRFPFRLFEYHRQLLKEGVFDAYNQWIFGSAQNLTAFKNWTNTHTEEYSLFQQGQKNRLFKVPESGQYYQTSSYEPGR
jgi:Tfp pilus assembly protein PilF